MDIFSRIAAGEIPSYKCAENEEFYAFLDINPVVRGHVLVHSRSVFAADRNCRYASVTSRSL